MSTYDHHDIKTILNRAAELQHRSGRTESVSRSNEHLTLGEIEEIAIEAGVSPDYVREAALEYEGIPVEKPIFVDTGDFNRLELLGFAKGKLDQRTWAELRSIIEYHFDSPGKVIRRPDGIQWKAKPKGILKFLESRKSPEVEINSTNNRTSIHIRKSLKTVNKFYIPSIALFLAGTFTFTMMLVGEMGNDIAAGMLVLGFFFGIGELFRRWAKRKKQKRRDQLKDLMQQLQAIVTRRYEAANKQKTEKKTGNLQLDSPLDEPEMLNYMHKYDSGNNKKSKT